MTSRSFSFVSFVTGAALTACVATIIIKVRADESSSSSSRNTAGTQTPNKQSSHDDKGDDSRTVAIANAERHCWKIVDHSFAGALIYVMDDLGLYDALIASKIWRSELVIPNDGCWNCYLMRRQLALYLTR